MAGPVYVGVRRDGGGAVLMRFPSRPWLEEVVDRPLADGLVCPLGHGGPPAWLVVSRAGAVSCVRCRNVWPFPVQAQVDVVGGRAVLVAGDLDAYPTACRICGCSDDRACGPPEGPCWWIAPGVCSSHDVRRVAS